VKVLFRRVEEMFFSRHKIRNLPLDKLHKIQDHHNPKIPDRLKMGKFHKSLCNEQDGLFLDRCQIIAVLLDQELIILYQRVSDDVW
jgi:hypothetical protein